MTEDRSASLQRPRRRMRWALGVPMAVALVMVSASPASAAASGSGVGAGVVSITGRGIQSTPRPCAEISNVKVDKVDDGTWTVNTATYVGSAEVDIEVPLHYANPGGTHTDGTVGNACADPIDTVSRVKGAVLTPGYALGLPGVSCNFPESTSNTFRREGTQVTFVLNGSCTVRSATGVTSTDSTTTLTQRGQFLGCPPFVSPDPITYRCLYEGIVPPGGYTLSG